MPSKNTIKFYIPNSVYHIYNRGVEKRKIFMDEQDHKVFLNYLKEYLSPQPDFKDMLKDFTLKGQTFKGLPKQTKNYFGEIELLAFCLMPNHIHLIIKQKDKDSIKKFTQSLFTRYATYFNKRYQRTGSLFQGRYKATNAINKDYLLDLSRYIHKNPLKYTSNIIDAYSSYSNYLGLINTSWINKNLILDHFNQSSFMKKKGLKSYQEFVEKFKYINENLDLERSDL